MSLFGHNYSKPGKGVDKNAPKKNAFFLFWELLGRKISKYIILNLMYLIIILPIVVYVYGMFYAWFSTLVTIEAETIASPLLEIFRMMLYYIPKQLQLPLLIVSLVLYGPFTAGLTYIIRNYVREEHAWLTDFFRKSWQNLRQGLVFGLLDIIAVVILYVNWNYGMFSGAETVSTGLFAVFLKYFTAVLFVLYVFIHFYTYQIAVTTELSVRAILKNSWIFAVLGLGRNIIALLTIAAAVVIAFFINPLFEMLTVILILFSFCRYVAIYTTYPVIDKYIVKPALEAEEQSEDNIDELLGGRGGELPPELGGPGAGAIQEEDNNTEQ